MKSGFILGLALVMSLFLSAHVAIAADPINVALGKKSAWHSSPHEGSTIDWYQGPSPCKSDDRVCRGISAQGQTHAPWKAVDGKLNTFSRTKTAVAPCWELDLGSIQLIDFVRVYDVTETRGRISLEVSQKPFPPDCGWQSSKKKRGRNFDYGFFQVEDDKKNTLKFVVRNKKYIRYVRVRHETPVTSLRLAEVQVFSHKPKPVAWKRLSGAAHDIGIGADGTVWVIGTNKEGSDFGIYRWNGKAWDKIPGAAVRIAVGPKGHPWGTNDRKEILHDKRSVAGRSTLARI